MNPTRNTAPACTPGGYDSGHCTGVPILDWYYGNSGDPDAPGMLTGFADAACISEAEKFLSIDHIPPGWLPGAYSLAAGVGYAGRIYDLDHFEFIIPE